MQNKIRNTTGRPQNVLKKEHSINDKITVELLPGLPSFVSEYDDYLDGEGRSVNTRYAYMSDLSHFFEYMTQDTGLTEATLPKNVTLSDIERLSGRDINAYLNYTKRYEAADGTVIENGKDSRARKRSSIVGLLKYLYKQDLIDRDITGKIMTVSVKDSSRAVKALRENEVIDLLEVVTTGKGLTAHQKSYWEKTKYRDKLIITLFVVTGLRISELQQLNISSFNLKREEFIIYRKRGKESVMPMNRAILDAFNEYMLQDRVKCTDVASGHEDALFLCLTSERKSDDGSLSPESGRKRLSAEQIRALVHKYTNIVIGGGGYSPHKLRATTATNAIRRGHDVLLVANLLDHDSIVTTQKYVNVNQQQKKQVIEDF